MSTIRKKTAINYTLKALILLLVSCAIFSKSYAKEPVNIKVISTSKFARVLFYSKDPISFKSSKAGNKVNIKFSEDYAFILPKPTRKLKRHISQIVDNGGNNVNITLNASSYRLRKFLGEDFAGIDFVPSGEPVSKKDQQQINKKTSNIDILQNNKSDLKVTKLDQSPKKQNLKVATPINKEAKIAAKENIDKTPFIEKKKLKVIYETAAVEAESEEPESNNAEDSENIVEEPEEESEIDSSEAEEAKKVKKKKVSKKIELRDFSKENILHKIKFPTNSQEVAAAIFQRAGFLWVIFNKAIDADIDSIVKNSSEYISSGENIKNRHYTILRFELEVGTNISSYKENGNWVVAFTDKKISPKNILDIDMSSSSLHGSRILIPNTEKQTPVRLWDPEVGDEMIVIPFVQEQIGLARTRKHIDFHILPTAQGAAVQIISDDVNVEIVKYGTTFAGPTDRLAGNAQAKLRELQEKERLARLRAERLRSKTDELSLVKYNTWSMGGKKTYLRDLRELEWQVTEADWSDKSEFRLKLAQFYLSHGLESEAFGVLKVIEEYDKDFIKKLDFKMAKGVALFFLARYQDSADTFETIDVTNLKEREKSEVKFWKSAAYFKVSRQIRMDKFIANNPLEEDKKKKEEIDLNDQVEVTNVILETTDRLMKIIRKIDDDFANEHEVRTLESTVKFVAQHYQEAIRRFEETDIYRSGNIFEAEEGKLRWGTSNLRKAGKIDFDFFKGQETFLRYYTDEVFNDLSLVALEERLDIGDIAAAEKIIDLFKEEKRFQQKGSIEFLKGLFYAKDEDNDNAIEIWTKLSEDLNDRYNRARANYALTTFLLGRKKITLQEAIDRLNSIRSVWRGDILELNILNLLGEFYMDQKQYIEGFKVWRQVVTNFPGSEESLLTAKKMSHNFVRLFNQGAADEIPQLEALTLFYEFRDLTPVGKVGDEMISRLADRLVKIDLLGRAAALLTHQVRFRLEGEERDNTSTKLVTIHMMNNKPQLALDVLNATDNGNMSPEIATKRKYLRARALIEVGRNNQVLSLLKGDEDNQAAFLRAEVYWREKVWKKVVDELEGPFREIRRNQKSLTEPEAEQILRLAVSYAIIERKKRLQILYEDFLPFIEDENKKKVLTFVAQDRGDVNYNDLNYTVEVDDMKNFLDKYLEGGKNVAPQAPEDAGAPI
ncbi:hypothetical protein N9W34_05010 [Rickettsiales bacterium]|nr:hypothetical protein [Rickettsiales bacterium]